MRLPLIVSFFTVLAGLGIPVGVSPTSEIIRGPVSAEVLRVMDGDTIVVRARIWLGQDIETRVRLDGVDTPEMNGKCERERRMALKARDWVASLAAGGKVILRDIKYGKYAGRVVARVGGSGRRGLSPFSPAGWFRTALWRPPPVVVRKVKLPRQPLNPNKRP